MSQSESVFAAPSDIISILFKKDREKNHKLSYFSGFLLLDELD